MIRTNRRVLLAKVQTGPGVPAIPDGTNDAIAAQTSTYQVTYDNTPTTEQNGSISAGPTIIGLAKANISITIRMKGSGTADVPPDWGVLLRGCSMTETINEGTDVTYSMNSSSEYLTIWDYLDGRLRKASDCLGNLSWTFTANQEWVGEFTFEGRHDSDEDGILPVITVDATLPPQWTNFTANLDGAAAAISSLTGTLGNNIGTLVDPNTGQNGIYSLLIGARAVTGQADPVAVLRATRNLFSNIASKTEIAVDMINGGTAGNILEFHAPTAQILNETGVDDQGAQRDQYALAFNGTDSECTFVTK